MPIAAVPVMRNSSSSEDPRLPVAETLIVVVPVTFPATVNLSEVPAVRFASRTIVPPVLPPVKFPPSAMVRMVPSVNDTVVRLPRSRFSKLITAPEIVDAPFRKVSVSVPAPPSICVVVAVPPSIVTVSLPPPRVTEPPVICPETVIVSLPVPAVTDPRNSALDSMPRRSPKKRGSDTLPGPAGKSIAILPAVPTVAPLFSVTVPTVPPENFIAAPALPTTFPVTVICASSPDVFFTYIPWRPPAAEAAVIVIRNTP